MDPRLRIALVFIAASLGAVYLGWQVAEGSYFLPSLAAVLTIAAILVRHTGLAVDTILVGLLLIGYIIGNRGFAQLMPSPTLPLLPAEAGLLVAVGWRTLQCAFQRSLPFQRDALNWVVLAWLIAGTVRVAFDVSSYGFLALRDYATVYYATFFFLVQHMGREPAARRYLTGCLTFAVLVLGPVYLAFLAFPDFFLDQLTVFNVPLIYFKGDLAVTFLAAGSLLIFHLAKKQQRVWAWPAAAAMFLFVVAGGNRASLLGLLVACGLLLLARHWRYPALQGAVTAAALLTVVILGGVFDNAWASRRLHGLTDQVVSTVDVTGSGTYQSEDSFNKGDNNLFRLIWWKNVAEETWVNNPVFGLGFGADLAHGFLQEYYADSTEEFSTRSPHSIFMTTFGRMGFAGLAVWLVFCGILFGKTWTALRKSRDAVLWSLWCACCIILVSASLGVVLEGPMGAVVFWTLLGLANSYPPENDPPAPAPTAPLPAAAPPV